MNSDGQTAAALRRLAEAFPKASASPMGVVEAVSTCDEDGAWRSSALRGADVTTADVVDALTLVRSARHSLDSAERRLIDAARSRDLSWKEIAHALDIDSPQGAQSRRQRLGTSVARRRS